MVCRVWVGCLRRVSFGLVLSCGSAMVALGRWCMVLCLSWCMWDAGLVLFLWALGGVGVGDWGVAFLMDGSGGGKERGEVGLGRWEDEGTGVRLVDW